MILPRRLHLEQPAAARAPRQCQMDAVADSFRLLPGALRSDHPQVSARAQDPLAEQLCAEHSLEFGLGEWSPLARCEALGGSMLNPGTRR